MKKNSKSDKPKKNKNMYLFFVQMLILFMLVQVIINFGSMILGTSIMQFKYGNQFIFELISLLIVIIVLLLSKNSYIFKDEHTNFFKSIFLGLPLLLISVIVLIGNIILVGKVKYVGNLLNLILFSASIGLFEEFLCRGWLQNEFIERYGNNRKNVIKSIILSSLVFGAIHFINFLSGQPFIPTIFQVFSATAVGIVLGTIYFRSKNIWSVAFIHAFWDFAIFYGEIFRLRDCTPISSAYSSPLLIISSLFNIITFLLMSIILLRKEKINELVGEEVTEDIKNKDKKKKIILFILLIISLICTLLPIDSSIETETCYDYKEEKIDDFEVTYPSHKKYNLVFTNGSYTLSSKGNKLLIKNYDDNKVEASYDYLYNYIVIENDDNFIIAFDSEYDNYGTTVKVATINKNEFSNIDNYFKNLNFMEYKIPELTSIGSMRVKDSNDRYLYFRCTNLPGLFLKDGKVKLLMTIY